MVHAFREHHPDFQPQISSHGIFRSHYNYAWLSTLVERSGQFYL